MNESENFDEDQGEMDIRSTLIIPDDNCDHLKCILWDMRQRSDLRKAFNPRPKPQYHQPVWAGCKSVPKPMAIGVRNRYSIMIVRGIFQLHMLGQSDLKIAKSLGMPEEEINRIIHQRNSTTEREWRRVQTESSLPTAGAILSVIAKEARYVYGNDAAPL